MSADEIVSHYITHYRDAASAEMRFYQIHSSASAAIHKAALCILPSGKRHPHQRRIPKVVLEKVEARLQLAEKKLAKTSDFAVLHELVERETSSIHGIGALTIYDISHRLGAYFGHVPELVYLHAGTKSGAALLGLKGDSIDPEELPGAFSRLTCAEIEDCLCIYRNDLLKARRTQKSSCRSQRKSICYLR